ncbi:MAG: FAD-dependent monooxygenase [Phycisphaerales bacterium]|nr:FAD-dependent monooxygenase [Phycisphaerales bacterium]
MNAPSSVDRPDWDVVIIGAGVAGAATACALAGSGRRVLLADHASWPRDKTCGCCLNPAGVALLDDLGVLDEIASSANVLHTVHLHARGAMTEVAHAGLAVRRTTLDDALVRAAVSSGVEFAPSTSLHVRSRGDASWTLDARRPGHASSMRATTVVVADGLQGRSLEALPEFDPRIRSRGRIGLSCVVPTAAPRDGVVRMYLRNTGYLGVVDLPSSRAAVALAVDPAWLKEVGGPHHAIRILLGGEEPDLDVTDARILATPRLTRTRSRVAAPGLFVVGDASGYVEPLSGEGMTWALASASLLGHLLLQEGLRDTDAARQWTSLTSRALRSRQRWAAFLRFAASRIPAVAALGVRAGAMPGGTRLLEAALRRSARPYDLQVAPSRPVLREHVA